MNKENILFGDALAEEMRKPRPPHQWTKIRHASAPERHVVSRQVYVLALTWERRRCGNQSLHYPSMATDINIKVATVSTCRSEYVIGVGDVDCAEYYAITGGMWCLGRSWHSTDGDPERLRFSIEGLEANLLLPRKEDLPEFLAQSPEFKGAQSKEPITKVGAELLAMLRAKLSS